MSDEDFAAYCRAFGMQVMTYDEMQEYLARQRRMRRLLKAGQYRIALEAFLHKGSPGRVMTYDGRDMLPAACDWYEEHGMDAEASELRRFLKREERRKEKVNVSTSS